MLRLLARNHAFVRHPPGRGLQGAATPAVPPSSWLSGCRTFGSKGDLVSVGLAPRRLLLVEFCAAAYFAAANPPANVTSFPFTARFRKSSRRGPGPRSW